MTYLGDIALGDTIDCKFATVNTSGVPTTLAGTPVISAYPGNSTTQLTAGITLTVDFDGVTGLHNVRIVASSGNGYATATNYALVITTGTVSGSSVVGYVIGHFSIEARSALRPTVAARTLDVSSGGEAGLDWANIGSPTTAQNLSATNIDVDQVIASVSGAVGSVTGAVGSVTGNVGGNVTGSVGSIATNGITAASIAANAIDADALAADAVTEIQSGLATAANLATVAGYLDTEIAAILADTNELQTDWVDGGRLDLILDARASQSSVDTLDNFVDTEIAAIITTLGTPAGASISADIAVIEAQTDDIGVAGAGLTALASAANLATVAADVWDVTLASHVTAGSTGAALNDATAPTAAAVADAVWDEALAGHLGAGSTGEALNAAGAAGDPWTTGLPGAYGAGSAGYIIGTNLDTVVSTRASQSSLNTLDDYVDTEVATILSRLGTPSDLGSGATVAANLADIEAQTDDIGSAGAGLTALASAANLDTLAGYVDTEVAAIKAKTDNLPADPADQSAVEAAITAATSPLATAANLATLAAYVDTEVAAILVDTGTDIPAQLTTIAGYLDTEIAAIKAKTDNLPTDPADQSAVEAAITTATTGLATASALSTISGLVDDLEGRLSATRAGYLDNLSAGAVALQSSVDSLEAGVVLTNAGIDAIFDRTDGVETGYTLRQALRLMAAALAGELSGAATTTITIRNITDTKARITATVDSDGNRSALTLDAT